MTDAKNEASPEPLYKIGDVITAKMGKREVTGEIKAITLESVATRGGDTRLVTVALLKNATSDGKDVHIPIEGIIGYAVPNL